MNFSRGVLSGSLCRPLCSGQLQFKRCLGHGVKVHVMEADWGGRTVVLKAPAALGEQQGLAQVEEKAGLTQAEFLHRVCRVDGIGSIDFFLIFYFFN